MTGTERPCPDDLLARARWRDLSELEGRALAAHLGSCEACRTSVLLSGLFREGVSGAPDDAAIVARIARRASARHVSRRGGRWLRGGAVATTTLVALLVAGGALALVGRQGGAALRSIFHRHLEVPTKASNDLAPRDAFAAVQRWPVPEAARPVIEAPVSRVKRRTATARGANTSVVERLSAPSAAALFADANATRRRGDLHGAAALYQALRRQFPEASEARLSAISLGDVLLDLGAPARALDAYDAYLAENAAGSLREEALFGRTRCLRALGRGAAERDTWQMLLGEFPRSAYASLAHRRIAELPR